MVRGVRSLPLTAGKHRAGTIKAHHATAAAPRGVENLPRFHGPGLNLLTLWSQKSLIATGIVKAVYCPIAPILNTAPMATGDANIRRPRRAPTVRTPQIAQTGVMVFLLTLDQKREPGIAPSRAKAKQTLLAVIVTPCPTKNCAMTFRENIASPAFGPRTCTQRAANGCP